MYNKDLIYTFYLNDACKHAIIESCGQEEILLDVENSLNVSYDIQRLKCRKQNSYWGLGN